MLVNQGQRELRGAVQSQRQRGCDAPAMREHQVAVNHAGIGVHRRDADGGGFAELIVGVGGGAGVGAVAAFEVAADKRARDRRLGDGVDGATGGATAEHQARGAFHHLDFLVSEAVAGIGREIAQAVEIDVVLGVEAADLELVAREGAAFPDGDGDAGDVAQRLAQSRGSLLLHGLFADHRDRLGRVLKTAGRQALNRRLLIQRVLLVDRGVLDGGGAEVQGGWLRRLARAGAGQRETHRGTARPDPAAVTDMPGSPAGTGVVPNLKRAHFRKPHTLVDNENDS